MDSRQLRHPDLEMPGISLAATEVVKPKNSRQLAAIEKVVKLRQLDVVVLVKASLVTLTFILAN